MGLAELDERLCGSRRVAIVLAHAGGDLRTGSVLRSSFQSRAIPSAVPVKSCRPSWLTLAQVVSAACSNTASCFPVGPSHSFSGGEPPCARDVVTINFPSGLNKASAGSPWAMGNSATGRRASIP